VVYADVYDAKNAVDALKGFNIGGRYLAVSYHRVERAEKIKELKKAKRELRTLQQQSKS
jgi:hypothetical protein